MAAQTFIFQTFKGRGIVATYLCCFLSVNEPRPRATSSISMLYTEKFFCVNIEPEWPGDKAGVNVHVAT